MDDRCSTCGYQFDHDGCYACAERWCIVHESELGDQR